LPPELGGDGQPYRIAGTLQSIVGAPFYPTPEYAIRSMLDLAGVNSDSVVYDLGCGDGGIVVAAAKHYAARKAVGIEKSKKLCSIALRKTRGLKNASIIEADYDTVDLTEASVVTLYQSATENGRLKGKFLKELSKGTTIVSHDFGIPGWHPTQFCTFRDHRRSYRVIVYVMGSHSRPPLSAQDTRPQP
jgi:Histone methylation protein DOT1